MVEKTGGNQRRSSSKKGVDEVHYLARFPGLVDLVLDEGELCYLVAEEDMIKRVSTTYYNRKRYSPPPMDQLPFLLPRWSEIDKAFDNDTPAALFEDLIKYHQSFCYLPSEAHYLLLVAWDFSTYILDYLDYSGYIYLYAVPERGKTKTGQSMINVAYRGIHQEDLREANLFRASHDLGASLFLDISNLSRKAYQEGSQDILLQRFEKGARVRRVHHPERGAFKDSQFYDVFGASIIATNEPISEVLESRSFSIDMPYATHNYPKPQPADGLPFRERLVAWKADFMLENPTLPPPPQFPTGRLNDIAIPLWQIIKLVSPDHCQQFEDFIFESAENRRHSKSSTIEGELIKAMLDLSSEVEEGKLEVDKVTDKINIGRKDYQRESSRYIGKVLRRLGFEMSRRHSTKRKYIYDTQLLEKLSMEYGLSEKPAFSPEITSQTSPASQTSQTVQPFSDNRVQRDMWDIRDIKIEGAALPGETNH